MRGESWLIYFGSSMSGLRTFLGVWVSRWLPPPPPAGHHRSGGAADHADAGERRAEPPELLPVQAAGWGLRRERRPSAARPGRGQAAAGGGRPWNAPQQPETGSWQPVVSDGQATLNYAKVVVIGTLQSFCTFRSNIERYFHTTSRYSSHTKTQGCNKNLLTLYVLILSGPLHTSTATHSSISAGPVVTLGSCVLSPPFSHQCAHGWCDTHSCQSIPHHSADLQMAVTHRVAPTETARRKSAS